jgi:hypothetical protein
MSTLSDSLTLPTSPLSGERLRSLATWLGIWTGLGLLLLAIALASHWPVRHGYFIVDDFLWLHIANWHSVADSFVGSQGEHIAYRPIFRLSTYIDALLFGRNPVPWHIENLVMHAANALLLAATVRAFRLPLSAAAAAALLFVLAPLSGESVNWISGRTTLLCAFFMLLCVWRWTVALDRRRRPYAATIWMVLAAASYETAVVTPAVLLCLVPIACRRLGVDWRQAMRETSLMTAVLAVFWLFRLWALGTVSAKLDETGPDLWGNFLNHSYDLYNWTWILAGKSTFLLLTAMAGLALLIPRLGLAAVLLLAIALILYLPYVPLLNIGGRFWYMLQAPICVLVVLPALIAPPLLRRLAMVTLLAVVLPGFAITTRREAASFSEAGAATAALVAAVRHTIPINDGYAHVIDGVPETHRGHLMTGYFFEYAIADDYKAVPPPFIVQSMTALANVDFLKTLLSQPTRFWRYDPEKRTLARIDCRQWLDTYRDRIPESIRRAGCTE